MKQERYQNRAAIKQKSLWLINKAHIQKKFKCIFKKPELLSKIQNKSTT